jgi:hypothetical protein
MVNYYGKILSSQEANQYFGLLMQNIVNIMLLKQYDINFVCSKS